MEFDLKIILIKISTPARSGKKTITRIQTNQLVLISDYLPQLVVDDPAGPGDGDEN